MKKKLIPLILAPVCAIACAFGLAACGGNGGGNGGGSGGKTYAGTVLVDGSGTELENEYDMGTYYYQGEKPDLSAFKLYAQYSDGSKNLIEASDSKLTIRYYHEHSEIDSLPDVYDVGEYTIEYKYTLSYDSACFVNFEVVPSATASPYLLSLDKNSWDYLEEPAVTVTKGGVAIDENLCKICSITKDKYDEIKDAADFNEKLDNNSENYYPDETKPGEYYLFAYIRKSAYDAYVYNSNFVAVGIFKGEVIPESTDFSDFKGGYDYGIHRTIGSVKISEIYIQGEMNFKNASGDDVSGSFEWYSPDTDINYTHNNAAGMAVKFVPEESDCYNEYILPTLVPLTIEKGLVPKYMISEIEYTYDGEEHEFMLAAGSSYNVEYFSDLVTVKCDGAEITVGEDGVLGRASAVCEHEYTFELKDKVNYCWFDSDDSDNVSDVANKTYTYRIKPRKSIVNYGDFHNIDENKQVKIPLVPGNEDEIYNGGATPHNITPYKGTLSVETLAETTAGEQATVDTEVKIVKEDGYDVIVITVKEFKEENGSNGLFLLKITAKGDDNYEDINIDARIYIEKYNWKNLPACPVIADLVENEQLGELEMEKPVGITVSELYAGYPELRTEIGSWVLYMDYNENGNWSKLSDEAALPFGRLKCKLVYESDFVWGTGNLRAVEFTLVGVQN